MTNLLDNLPLQPATYHDVNELAFAGDVEFMLIESEYIHTIDKPETVHKVVFEDSNKKYTLSKKVKRFGLAPGHFTLQTDSARELWIYLIDEEDYEETK